MKRTSLATVTAILLLSTMLFIGFGCSHDSPTGPADGIVSGDVSTVAKSKPVTEPTFVETFDKRSNVGSWSFFGNPDNRVERWESQEGNPGAFIHATCGLTGCLDTYAPKLRTQIGVSSIFTGDYREKCVTNLGVDLAIYGPEYVTTEGRPLSLLLRNDNGTPYDWADDVTVYWIGTKMIPHECGQFKEFVITVPSQSTTLPKGWGVLGGSGTGDDDADWNTVIGDVSQVTFFFGNPEMFFMFQQWELGFDNVSITLDE